MGNLCELKLQMQTAAPDVDVGIAIPQYVQPTSCFGYKVVNMERAKQQGLS